MNPTETSGEFPSAFTVRRHGEVVIIEASPALDGMASEMFDLVGPLVLDHLSGQVAPQVVVDLHRLDYFGSAFLGLLLKCWKTITDRGGQMVLAGVSPRARDLLHMTSLDVVWPIYDTSREAVESLSGE